MTNAQAAVAVSFEEFYRDLLRPENKDELDVLKLFVRVGVTSTNWAGKQLGHAVNERGNGREWIGQFLRKLPSIRLAIEPFERADYRNGWYEGFEGVLAKTQDGKENHGLYLLNVAGWVIKHEMARIEAAAALDDLGEVSPEPELSPALKRFVEDAVAREIRRQS